MTEVLQRLVDFIWGLPLLGFIFTANIILVYHSRFLPLKGMVHAISLLGHKKEDAPEAEGQISHFQALCNAIAATVGLGNISGVAIAIATGGPGALFWMWVAALFGMNTKFFEVTIALLYRGRDYKGEVQGGAMYVIEKALPKSFKPLAWMFAICGFCGTFTLFQINQLALYGETYYGLDKMMVGVVFAVLTGIVLLGGLKGISRFCEIVVPIMSVLYFVVVAVILINNIDKAPAIFGSIFREALNPSSAFGGILGYGFLHILTTGTKRATFSNESGIGTAPMAHSNSKTNEPISEGYVAMLGPFIDTIIVCSLTAFAILVTFPQGAPEGVSGIQLTTLAFTEHMGIWGQHFLAVSIMMFALSTMIGVANYNHKCWDYIFKGRWFFKDKAFILVFCGSLLVGAVVPMENVVNFMDIAFALMTIPNIIATVYLAKKVKTELDIYNLKKNI
jgi:alanine or glycine:cation symporter, AGCS family